MRNTFGNSFSVTIFGESHGEKIGCVIDGLTPGITIDVSFIKNKLRKRTVNSTSGRKEADDFEIISGVFNGKSTGTPICLLIPNNDVCDKDYDFISKQYLARPGHADYTNYVKFNGNENPLGGGHSSGRITAALVAAGAIAELALLNRNIEIETHVLQLQNIKDKPFNPINPEIEKLKNSDSPYLSDDVSYKVKELIEQIKLDNDSVGGILETAICGLPCGIGEPWFDSIESKISHIAFSIPAVKGIEFGAGFDFSTMLGSESNDQFYFDGQVKTKTNNNGGINGGISNGMPIIFSTVIKPTPTINQEQDTINIKDNSNQTVKPSGRHDVCIALKAPEILNAVAAIAIADLLAEQFGNNWANK